MKENIRSTYIHSFFFKWYKIDTGVISRLLTPKVLEISHQIQDTKLSRYEYIVKAYKRGRLYHDHMNTTHHITTQLECDIGSETQLMGTHAGM